jgi:hypothetical protein
MSLLDVMGERALRGAAGARHLYAKLHRALVTLNNTKVVIVPPKPSNGRAQAPPPAAPSAPAPPPGPTAAPAGEAGVSALAPDAVAAPQPSPVPEPPVIGAVVRRPSAIFTPPPSSAENPAAFPLRPAPQDGRLVFGERGASGARLLEARRLNRIAIFGVAVGILNLLGLIVAITFAGSMLRAVATTTGSTEEAMKIDRRAWVGLGDASLGQPYARTNLGMTFVFENSGKTPADVDGIEVTVAAVAANSNRRSKISSWQAGSRSIAPGARESLAVFEPRPLSNAGFAALLDRRVRHEFSIIVRYHDVFGDTHRTDVCRAIEGSVDAMTLAPSLPSCSPNAMD